MLKISLPYNQKPSFNSIRKSIIISLSLIFAFSLFLVIGINIILTQGSYDVKMINLAGKQRMLSQKIIKKLYFIQSKEGSTSDLKQNAELWHQMHLSLQFGNASLKIPATSNTSVDSILTAITPYHEQLYAIAMQPRNTNLSSQELQLLNESQHKYLEGMELVVAILEKEFNLQISNIKSAIAFLTLLFILFIWALYRLYIRGIIESVRLLSLEKERQSRHMGAILESTKNQIWTFDRKYRLISYNWAFVDHRTAFFGIVPKTGDNLLNFPFTEERHVNIKNYFDKALSGKSFVIETEIELHHEMFYYELSFNPILDENNKVNGCSVYQIDITQRINTWNKLKESERSLVEAQKIANIGSWDWDVSKNEIKCSKQIYLLFGMDPKELKFNHEAFMSHLHPEDRIRIEKDFHTYIDHQDSFNISNRIIRKDGSLRHVRHLGKVYFDKNNAMIRVTGTTQDISLMEKSKQQILQQYRELQSFVYIVSHNVRGPISTLLSLLQLYDQNSSMNKDEIVRLINLTVDKLDSTIKDLNHSLSLKNISQSDMEKIDLNDIIDDVLVLISSEIKKCNAKINLDFAYAQYVFGSRSYYSNIFYNLILNSLKYKSNDRPLKIDICSKPNSIGGVEIVISDNGLGMDLNIDRRKKIFDMYGRLSSSTNGKGLGLYLVKTQVEAMGGTIEVDSEFDKGTTFTVNVFANF